MPGEDIDPNANVPVHLEGTGPGVLMDTEEDQPEDMLEEDGITWENASVKEDRVPCIELQESRVSHLATPEKDIFLILSSSSSPPTTSDTARMQHLLAINTGTLAIPIVTILGPIFYFLPFPPTHFCTLSHSFPTHSLIRCLDCHLVT